MSLKRGVKIFFIVVSVLMLIVVSRYVNLFSAKQIDDQLERNSDGIIKGMEPYYLDNGNETGILLIHGFTANPKAMGGFADFLYEEGYTVYVPLLAGHGTNFLDFENNKWEDWQKSAEDALEELMTKTENVYVMGHSMGGILALDLASKYDVKGVISIAAPIEIEYQSVDAWPLIYLVQPYLLRPVYSSEESKKNVDEGIVYPITPVLSVVELIEFMNIARIRLYGIFNEPVLIIQSYIDGTVDPISAEHIYDGVSSDNKKVVWIYNSTHTNFNKEDMETIKKELVDFLE